MPPFGLTIFCVKYGPVGLATCVVQRIYELIYLGEARMHAVYTIAYLF